MNAALTAATTSWPEAAIAIAGVALVGAVTVVVVWQALLTWRTRIAVTREQQYRALAEQTSRDLAEIRERLGGAQHESEEEQNDH
jgi:flagellar biosynthesis/type III secretory pathway M-ring protein FliF/YscJ